MSDLKLPKPLTRGYKRQWVQCGDCGAVSYYDYIPYSLSSPIMVMPCNHRFDNVARIPHSEAMYLLYPQLFGTDKVMESAFAGLADALEAQDAELLQEVVDLWDVWGYMKENGYRVDMGNAAMNLTWWAWMGGLPETPHEALHHTAEWVRQQEGDA